MSDELFPADSDNNEAATQEAAPEPHPMDTIISVQLRKKYGSVFAGEKCGLPAHIAKALLANGGAYPLDEDGNAIIPPEDVVTHPAPPLNNFVEPGNAGINGGNLTGDDGGPGDVGQPTGKRSRRRQQPANQPAAAATGGSQTPITDDMILPFLADGLQRDEAGSLYNAGLKTPDDVAKALAEGRDLSKEVNGIGPKTFADLKMLYGADSDE